MLGALVLLTFYTPAFPIDQEFVLGADSSADGTEITLSLSNLGREPSEVYRGPSGLFGFRVVSASGKKYDEVDCEGSRLATGATYTLAPLQKITWSLPARDLFEYLPSSDCIVEVAFDDGLHNFWAERREGARLSEVGALTGPKFHVLRPSKNKYKAFRIWE